MKLFLSPHNDDECLFGAYTLMREKPLVLMVTDSYIQFNRGDGITAEQRRQETIEALTVLGCEVHFLGIKDTELTKEILKEKLNNMWYVAEKMYIPAVIENGNPQHNLIGEVCKELYAKTFGSNLISYMSYSKTDLWKKGSIEIVPTQAEIELKNKALRCYRSQILLPSTAPHFQAVMGRSEWYE